MHGCRDADAPAALDEGSTPLPREAPRACLPTAGGLRGGTELSREETAEAIVPGDARIRAVAAAAPAGGRCLTVVVVL